MNISPFLLLVASSVWNLSPHLYVDNSGEKTRLHISTAGPGIQVGIWKCCTDWSCQVGWAQQILFCSCCIRRWNPPRIIVFPRSKQGAIFFSVSLPRPNLPWSLEPSKNINNNNNKKKKKEKEEEEEEGVVLKVCQAFFSVFQHSTSFNPPNILIKQFLLLSSCPCYRWGNWGTKKLRNLP